MIPCESRQVWCNKKADAIKNIRSARERTLCTSQTSKRLVTVAYNTGHTLILVVFDFQFLYYC